MKKSELKKLILKEFKSINENQSHEKVLKDYEAFKSIIQSKFPELIGKKIDYRNWFKEWQWASTEHENIDDYLERFSDSDYSNDFVNESLDTVGSDILKKITGEDPKTSSKNAFRTPSYISNVDGGPSVTTIDKYFTLEDYVEEFKSKYGEEPTFDKSGKQYGKILWKPTNPKFLERSKTSDSAVKNFGTKGD